MKAITDQFICAMALVLLPAGCQKETPNGNNPEELSLPSAPFTVTVCEREPGVKGDSLYNFYATLESGHDYDSVTFNAVNSETSPRMIAVQDDRLDLALTPWNTILFEASADVNASSSADGVDVVRVDGRHYRLSSYRRDCSTTVSFWNGDGAHRTSVRVRAAASIPCEGFLMRYDGKDHVMQVPDTLTAAEKRKYGSYVYSLLEPEIDFHATYSRFCLGDIGGESIDYGKDKWTIYRQLDSMDASKWYDREKFHTVELVGTIPRNATPDNCVKQVYDEISMAGGPGFMMPSIWGETRMTDYRWMPNLAIYKSHGPYSHTFEFVEYVPYTSEYQGEIFHGYRPKTHPVPDPGMGDLMQDMYPADMRYLKAQIYVGKDHFFGYQTGTPGNEKRCWAYVYYIYRNRI